MYVPDLSLTPIRLYPNSPSSKKSLVPVQDYKFHAKSKQGISIKLWLPSIYQTFPVYNIER